MEWYYHFLNGFLVGVVVGAAVMGAFSFWMASKAKELRGRTQDEN